MIEIGMECRNLFSISILGTFAAQESKSISDNLKWAWRRKFAKGEAALPCAPYPLNPTLTMLYLSYPISWIITFAVHFGCYLWEKKRKFGVLR